MSVSEELITVTLTKREFAAIRREISSMYSQACHMRETRRNDSFWQSEPDVVKGLAKKFGTTHVF